MAVIISMLRGVNVGTHNRMKMDALRAVYESLDLRNPQTYVQSGNIVFKTGDPDMPGLCTRIEHAIERSFGFRAPVIARTVQEMRDVVARNPFAGRLDIDPASYLVLFLSGDPGQEARDRVLRLDTSPEEFRCQGREVYVHYANGMARPKTPWMSIEKILKTSGTGRNWNSVTKLLEMAEQLEAS